MLDVQIMGILQRDTNTEGERQRREFLSLPKSCTSDQGFEKERLERDS